MFGDVWRPECVYMWLKFLQRHNSFYADIRIDESPEMWGVLKDAPMLIAGAATNDDSRAQALHMFLIFPTGGTRLHVFGDVWRMLWTCF